VIEAGQQLLHPRTNGRIALNIAKLPELLLRSVLLNANASGISYTPAVSPALLAHSGPGLTDTVNHYPADATAHTGLRDRGVRLMKRRERHCLCGGSQSQAERSNSYCSDHCFLPFRTALRDLLGSP
jgi:hypothetical protein